MRLDLYLYKNGLCRSRTKAAEAIEKGAVSVNGKTVLKTSFDVKGSDEIELREERISFVSNGGYKLEKVFADFGFSAENLVFVDVGASTGGFTDCLLKHGAKKVFAVDVGESQLTDELKSSDKVVVKDNLNARNLTANDLGEYVDGAVCDVSFISLTYVLRPIYDTLKENGFAVVLLKPQFECGKKYLNKNGIVNSVKAREEAAMKIFDFANSLGFTVSDFTNAPLREGKNVEYLFYLTKNGEKKLSAETVKKRVVL